MVDFNELRVSLEGSKLVIDASVKNLDYYKDVYIDAVAIDSQDTYIENGVSTKPIYKYEVDTVALIEQYLSGEPCEFYGKGDIEIVRDLYKAIKFVRILGGEIELSVREFAVVRDIIIWKESGNGRFIEQVF